MGVTLISRIGFAICLNLPRIIECHYITPYQRLDDNHQQDIDSRPSEATVRILFQIKEGNSWLYMAYRHDEPLLWAFGDHLHHISSSYHSI